MKYRLVKRKSCVSSRTNIVMSGIWDNINNAYVKLEEVRLEKCRCMAEVEEIKE